MPDQIVYKLNGYSEALHCHFVEEWRGNTLRYIFRAYIKGNRAVLYPHKAMYTTEFKRDKIEVSIFDLKGI
jgi:hypothetical protein